MRARKLIPCLLGALFLCAGNRVVTECEPETASLIINGQSTQVPVVQVNGRSYVDLEALASAVNGSLSFAGNQIAFSMPSGSATGAPAARRSEASALDRPDIGSRILKRFLECGNRGSGDSAGMACGSCERDSEWIPGDGGDACAISCSSDYQPAFGLNRGLDRFRPQCLSVVEQ